MDHEAPVLARELHDAPEELEVDDLGGRIGGEVEDEELRLRPRRPHRLLEGAEEVAARHERDRAQVPARDDDRVLVDRVGGARAEDDVARPEHGEHQMAEPFLRAHGDDRLAVRV